MNRGFQYSGVTVRARVTGLFKLNHYDLDGSMRPMAYPHCTSILAKNSLTHIPLSSEKICFKFES